MPRANSTVPRKQKHKKIIKSAKGYFGTRKSNYRTAKDAVQKALQYSYRDRRAKKREFRRLWIMRINAAVRAHGLSYSKFISSLKETPFSGLSQSEYDSSCYYEVSVTSTDGTCTNYQYLKIGRD